MKVIPGATIDDERGLVPISSSALAVEAEIRT
jgi:hypothetical protein